MGGALLSPLLPSLLVYPALLLSLPPGHKNALLHPSRVHKEKQRASFWSTDVFLVFLCVGEHGKVCRFSLQL